METPNLKLRVREWWDTKTRYPKIPPTSYHWEVTRKGMVFNLVSSGHEPTLQLAKTKALSVAKTHESKSQSDKGVQ